MANLDTIYGRIKDAFGGISDKKLGDELGVSKQAVNQWHKGKTEPSEAVILIAAEKTGLPYKWFLTGDRTFLSTENKETLQPSVGPMTIERFKAELKLLGVEDANPIKSWKGLTPADMEEILEVARANARTTVTTMVEQKIKGQKGK